eukprot:2920030-Prymnesium_polylepis.1
MHPGPRASHLPRRGQSKQDRLECTDGARGATQAAPQDSHSTRAHKPLAPRRRQRPPARSAARLLPGCECRQGIRHP